MRKVNEVEMRTINGGSGVIMWGVKWLIKAIVRSYVAPTYNVSAPSVLVPGVPDCGRR